jgi:tetratricopeptide (TPR) repeat protein
LYTPDYASPEQFRGEPISTASDIYSLGAILYQMLTGSPPYRLRQMTPGQMEQTVTSVQPDRPSTMVPAARRPSLEGDLDNIVLTALRKEPERRYASAEALAEDIRRHLDGLPVLARPATMTYRTMKFLRRHVWGTAAVCLIVLSLVLGLAAALYQARLARQRYRDVRQLASRFLFDFDDSIRNLPGATHSRELVVQTGLLYLDRLYRDSGGDVDLLAELAAGYSKIGDVQGNPAMASLGLTKDALASYARSRELWEKVVAARPGDYKALRSLAQVRLVTGDLLRITGKTADAGRMFADGAAAAGKALGGLPDDPDLIFVTGGAWLRAGDLHNVQGQVPAARDDFERSLEFYRRAERLAPQDRYRNAEAIALSRLGLAASATDRLNDARTYHDQSLAIRQDLVDRNPNVQGYRRGLAAETLLAGAIFSSSQSLNLNDPDTAVHYFRRGLAIVQLLAKADPNDRTTQADLTIDNMRLCETLALIRPAEGLPYCTDAISIGTAVIAGMWRDDTSQYVALAELGQAQSRLALKQFAGVRASAESALRRLEHAGGVFVGIPYNRMRAHMLIGDSYAAVGDAAHAREAYLRAQAAADPQDDHSLVKLRQLAWLAERLAALPGDRCGYFRQADAYWEQWRARGGGEAAKVSVPSTCFSFTK